MGQKNLLRKDWDLTGKKLINCLEKIKHVDGNNQCLPKSRDIKNGVK
ncbi:MAG: hypothetical protein KIH08_16295 [Candidatus Freyarchaeota archaeon]|nr:hypothetical protein [Candidatus Jordarchaeia archaeon]